MAKSIDAKLCNIKGIFSHSTNSVLGSNGKFTIPDYQRAYTWTREEQCDKLWQDLESFVSSKNEAYFLGSIIINSVDKQLVVIDGQQRITTFMLLLKAFLVRISECLGTMSADEDSATLRDGLGMRRQEIIACLYAIDEEALSLVARGKKKFQELQIKYENLSINEQYRKEAEHILLNEIPAEIEKKVHMKKHQRKDRKFTNYYRNFLYFLERLNEKRQDPTMVNTLAKTLLHKCQVIVVTSYDTEEAIEIFNSLNSTGQPLGNADIISAKLYSNCGDKHEFNKLWEGIIEDSNHLSSREITSIDDMLNQYMYVFRAERGETDTTLPSVRLTDPLVFFANVGIGRGRRLFERHDN